jgi:hypothetical protein
LLGAVNRVTRGVYGLMFLLLLLWVVSAHFMGDLLGRLPWRGGHLVILAAALFLFYVLLRQFTSPLIKLEFQVPDWLNPRAISFEDLGRGPWAASERAAPPEPSAVRRWAERTTEMLGRGLKAAVAAAVIGFLAILGAAWPMPWSPGFPWRISTSALSGTT